MRALLCPEFGNIDKLTIGDVAAPAAPGPGDVLIDVHAAGVNFADLLMIGGQYQESRRCPSCPAWKWRAPCAPAAPE